MNVIKQKKVSFSLWVLFLDLKWIQQPRSAFKQSHQIHSSICPFFVSLFRTSASPCLVFAHSSKCFDEFSHSLSSTFTLLLFSHSLMSLLSGQLLFSINSIIRDRNTLKSFWFHFWLCVVFTIFTRHALSDPFMHGFDKNTLLRSVKFCSYMLNLINYFLF